MTHAITTLRPAAALRDTSAGDTGAATRRRALDGLPETARPTAASTDDACTLSVGLFHRLGQLEEGTPEYAYVRNTLIELNLSLVKFAARRFRGRPEPAEDIIQVGTIGLIKAIDRFDPSRGIEFSAYALPTVVGEMKRFFRDTGWAVHVPRRLQELRLDLAKASDTMEQRDGHRPSRAALAEHLHLTEEGVAQGQLAANGYTAHSLDAPIDGTEDDEHALQGTHGSHTAVEDPAYGLIDDLQSLRPLLEQLDERDRKIIELRFGEELTQAEIGRRLGLSQMHVSRLLAGILTTLHDGMLTDQKTEDTPADPEK
ncbi:SigB/SigF/SigG family RNA polymerase sigma factor [Streptomyces sp. NPDC058052]|uniref:SigB/SigF/SigG family RNA polymerase sigma factor n=1 Tax=Streptomyces sp. NPDC058052 TaxID=3346316 RepID=UPI0036F07F36